MESLNKGRQELEKLFDRVQADVANELDHDNSIYITREKLRSLREQSMKVGELEDEVSSLKQQKRGLEGRLNDARLAQDVHDRMAQDNAHLIEELGKYEGAAVRAEELEKENKRLATELQQAVRQLKDAEKVPVRSYETPRTTPGPTTPSMSMRPITEGDTKPVTREAHDSLIKKFNILHKNWMDVKFARDKLDKLLREERKKNVDWNTYADGKKKETDRKNDRIKGLDEEIQALRMQMQTLREQFSFAENEQTSSIRGINSSNNQGFEAITLQDFAKIIRNAPHPPIRYQGRVVWFDDIVKILESPELNKIIEASREVDVPASSPVRSAALGDVSILTLKASSREETAGSPSRPDEIADTDAENELPMLLSRGTEGDGNVQDTEFESIEPHHTSSTEGDTLSPLEKRGEHADATKPELPMHALSPQETPKVISVRSVKKRKGRKEPSAKPKVKIEILSSSPIGLKAFHELDPNQSIDLDDLGDKQVTPRKQRPLHRKLTRALSDARNSVRRAASETQASNGSDHGIESRSYSHEPTAPTSGHSRKNSAVRSLSTNKQTSPATSEDRVRKKRRFASDKAIQDLSEDGENFQGVVQEARKKNIPLNFSERLGQLLEKPTPPKTLIGSISPNRHSTLIDAAIDCPDLSVATPQTNALHIENLAGYYPDLPSRAALQASIQATTPISQNMFRDSAYGSRPPSRDTSNVFAVPLQLPQLKGMAAYAEFKLLRGSVQTPKQRQSKGNTPYAVSVKASRIGKRRTRATEDYNLDDSPENEPLRARPLQKLTIQDFKINPKYNQGYNYAFTEVVRNQADRRCLHGCTRPECCGPKFRALAAASRNPFEPLTASQEESNMCMLEEFMGDNVHKIRNMTKDERNEIWLQAKTRELANKYGKHRHAYERRQSPPGFWRADFPTTQEERDDRQLADKRERDVIEHRYREAMRPGGAYIFRDE